MPQPITSVVEVNVTKQEGIKSLEDFGALAYFTEDNTIATGQYATYTSVEDFSDHFPATTSVGKYGATFFAQSPTPISLTVVRVDETSGDTWPSRIETTLESLEFYAVGVDSLDLDSATMVSIAEAVEDNKLIWVQARRYSDALTIYQAIQAANYTRTAIISKDSDTDDNRLDAAWYGKCLTKDNLASGVPNWANQVLSGVTASAESPSNVDALLSAGVNVYVDFGSFKMTRNGQTAATDPTYIDQIIIMDYLRINIEQDVLDLVLNSDKIPYTDAGMKTVEGVVLNRLNQAISLGMLDPAVRPTATAPSVTTVSDTQKASRIAPTITATGRLSGAVNKFIIDVNVEI